jgi:predicted XRE-type DNA-binding protein
MTETNFNFVEEIRRHVDTCGTSRAEICRASGVSESNMSKFMAGAWIGSDTLNALALAIGLHVTRDPGPACELAEKMRKPGRPRTNAKRRTRKR